MQGARGCVVPLTQILAPLGIPMRCMPSLLTARPARLQRLALLNSTRLLSAPRLRGACSAASPEEPSSASFMEASVQAVIENIHASPTKAVVVVAGGGSQARMQAARAARAAPHACCAHGLRSTGPGVVAVRARGVRHRAGGACAILPPLHALLPGTRTRQVRERRHGATHGAAGVPASGAWAPVA